MDGFLGPPFKPSDGFLRPRTPNLVRRTTTQVAGLLLGDPAIPVLRMPRDFRVFRAILSRALRQGKRLWAYGGLWLMVKGLWGGIGGV